MSTYYLKRLYEDGKVKLFDYNLEGKTCPVCNGDGEVKQSRDLHRSAGIILCPLRNTAHGLPECRDGTLQFREYDKRHEKELKEKIRNGKLGEHLQKMKMK